MNKRLLIILLFSLGFQLVAGKSYNEKQIESVFDNLVLAYGNSKATPKLKKKKKETIILNM